jgi:hypothetical protein
MRQQFKNPFFPSQPEVNIIMPGKPVKNHSKKKQPTPQA